MAQPKKREKRCRNGARPERPGKHASYTATVEAGNHAAMEPGLRDRENLAARLGPPRRRGAAMEPGLRDRENCSQPAAPARPDGTRQGSPAGETGKPAAQGRHAQGQGEAAMEPGLRD